MNLRNKKLVAGIRMFAGLFLLMSSITGWMAAPEMQGIPEPMIPYMQQLWGMELFQLVKTVEIVIGLMFVTGFLPALAALFMAPIALCVLVVNAVTAPAYLPTAIILALFTLYFGYVYWDKYKAIFV